MSKTFFQDDWLSEPAFNSWLEKVPLNNKIAKCKLCIKTFELSNMGRRAVSSHMEGIKHKKKAEANAMSASFRCFSKITEQQSLINSADSKMNENKSEDLGVVFPIASDSQSCSSSSSFQKTGGMKSFLINDSVTKGEILWTIETVMTHTSLRTGRDVLLFKTIFSDSQIAQKMQLQRDKVGYLLAYGIAPLFQQELIDKLNKCDFLVVGFDESLNKVAQKQQMDINVRFWDTEKICTRYLTSVFLGRTRAIDLLESFKDGLQSVDSKKILQISMDGPNVNKKFLKDLKAEINTADPDEKKLLDLGSCGLHTLHCAFKSSMLETGWDIVPFLRALYNLFKDSPARRALFTSATKSTVFPKKFCAVRWLQNAEVAQRAIELIPNLMLFIDEIEKTKAISSQSYVVVSKAVKDQLLSAKLQFFKSIASDVEPFLKKFQSDEPLVPFLYEELTALLMTQISKILKPEAIKDIKSLKDLKIPEKNILPAGEISIGIATKSAIAKAAKKMGNKKDILIQQFRESCKKAFIKFINKMLEKSPLQYRLTKAVSCFDPHIAENSTVRKIRMETLLTILLDQNWITSSIVDRVMQEYMSLCEQPKVITALKSYDKKVRVDSFWMELINEDGSSSHLSNVLKLVCSLSHGNANLERGFSVNSECIVENMREELLVARRIVYDTILSIGGIYNLKIDKPLIHAARNSYSKFLEASKNKKKTQDENSLKIQSKRKAEMAMKELERKKAKILEDAQKQADLLNDEIKILSKI